MAITARFGLEGNPYDVGDDGFYTSAERTRSAKLAVRVGADNLSYSITWDQFETSEGVYDTTTLSTIVAARGTAKMQMTLAVLQYDGTKALPAYLVGNALNSATVKTAYRAAIDAIYTVVGATGMDIFLLGNEVEVYLSTHASEITPFAGLISDAKTYITGLSGWGSVKVSTSFKHVTRDSITTTYSAINGAWTYPAFTYYPITGYQVDDSNPATIATTMFNDLLALPTAVSNTVIITEMGLPSHTDLGSSESLQAVFYAAAPAVIQSIADFDGIYAAQFQWQTDWPEWLLDYFGFAGDARKFVGSIGIRTQGNLEKTAFAQLFEALGGTSLGNSWAVGSWVPNAWAVDSWASSIASSVTGAVSNKLKTVGFRLIGGS